MAKQLKGRRRILIGVRSRAEFDKSMKEFVEACKRAEKGLPPIQPIHRRYFESLELLWKRLSPQRINLMQVLRREGPLSIRKLAATTQRDYKNVHTDIQELLRLDLVKRTKDNLFEVPWDSIEMQINLAESA